MKNSKWNRTVVRFKIIKLQIYATMLACRLSVVYGLILNELLTNAYRHAFLDSKPRDGAERCEVTFTLEMDKV